VELCRELELFSAKLEELKAREIEAEAHPDKQAKKVLSTKALTVVADAAEKGTRGTSLQRAEAGNGIDTLFDAVHDSLLLAIETVLRERRCLTRDMGGTGNTADLGQAIVDAIS
jgi:hypothetical protein